jgi:phosphatidylserine decarboxylase
MRDWSGLAPAPIGDRFRARIGDAAAKALVAEFARHPGPKSGLVVGGAIADGGVGAVLFAAIDALTPPDSLIVVAGAAGAEIREQVAVMGSWVEHRVRVIDVLAEADPVDVVMLADLVSGGADEIRAELEGLGKHLNAGGVVCAAVAAAPFLAGDAGEEMERQAALYGVGSDLVLRNVPPVRVHRLRYTPPEPGLAERLEPLDRPSSVRLTRRMHIDSNGVAAAGICLGAAAALRRALPKTGLWVLPALAAPAVAAFFRDPQRSVPDDPTAVVAASDGRVLAVERVVEDRLGPEEFLRIAVFLSVLDVHVNRAPVAGSVVDYFRVDGGFAAAMKPEAEHNVAAYTVLQTPRGRVAVAQRTGLIARRIVHRAPVGSLLAKGERFGLIRFGSRTDVYLPADAAVPAVAPGERVAGGETVIARWL